MRLYSLPTEIPFIEVQERYSRNYKTADIVGKVYLKYWLHIAECQHKAGRLCVPFTTFFSIAGEMDLIEAVRFKIIVMDSDISSKMAILAVRQHFANRVVGNVVYIDFARGRDVCEI